ncbi:AAA family ATPase [Truepera radiovictrix]|uniref:2-phosphoglycerate kinase n=1 Tax=Truepera radiovictrix (strain DSM 17093 / CIP 108686 / LMG 22925 / RQ-24) TaxID=649638 RepID=D7CR54_TRURR|nr:AAA family ATPase [Truepera radiovictrix]ADI15142.1 2-phosphoglycerate kinase [Truepera radiovictrix DSM 17093]WMT56305.1 hypothetical protein RCV51_09850 [Truepera radiovictrix]
MKRAELYIIRDGDKVPFTLGAVVEALQGVGLGTDEAIRLARTLEKHHRQKGLKTVKLGALIETLAALVEEAYGPEMSARLREAPPFVPLVVRTESGEAPFSRRTLAAWLEKRGFSFKEGNLLARQVEGTLRRTGQSVIGTSELVHYTALAIGARYGQEARARFEAKAGAPSELLVRRDGGALPYSRGILAQSLMALGLAPELSHGLAKRTELLLWRLGEREVSVETVRRTVKKLLLQEAGEEFVRRYELLHSVRSPTKPLIVLIGGAPGVGKSSLASALAYRLGVPRIVSTDSVRQALRSLISAELSPALHASSFTAWRAELLPSEAAKPKRKRVIRGFQRQVQQLTTAVGAIISRSVQEATSLVLEGIHLVPGFLPLELEEATVVELVVCVSDPELHREYFGAREVQTGSRRRREYYLEHFGEIRTLQDFIVRQAKLAGVPVLEAADTDQLTDHAIEQVLNAVLAQQSDAAAAELGAVPQEVALP